MEEGHGLWIQDPRRQRARRAGEFLCLYQLERSDVLLQILRKIGVKSMKNDIFSALFILAVFVFVLFYSRVYSETNSCQRFLRFSQHIVFL